MIRLPSVVALSLLVFGIGSLAGAPGWGEGDALAQSDPAAAVRPRPRVKGRSFKLKIDSSPQQAAVYWDAGPSPSPRAFGIAGYTPIDIKVPKGAVKIIIELRGWKTQERDLDVRKPQPVSFTMERAPMPGKLDLRAGGDGSAAGADVAIDGVVRGTLPNMFEVFAGHHQIEIRKPGYKPHSEWIDLAEDERRTLDLALDKNEAPGGSLLVTSDVGGDVYVDGVRRDVAPAMISPLSAGDHIIEVRKEGAPPWRQSVTITSGQQSKVAATLAQQNVTGTVRVISADPQVEVFLDGEDKGHAPLELKNVAPGQHIIEGRKPAFKPQEQSVQVAAGAQAVVELRLEPAAEDRPKARIRVQSLVPDAEVFLDGSSMGKAPVERSDLDPGKHYIVVRKEGYAEFKREVVLVENVPLVFAADLKASASLKFLSTPKGAAVVVDGEPIGLTPTQRPDVGAGEHIVEFRLPGYFDSRQTVKVEGGKERIVAADMKPLPSGPSPDQVVRRRTGMSSWGAKALPRGGFVADLGTGYPYFLFARLTVGAFDLLRGLDLGVEFQSFIQMNTLAVHGRLQLAESGPLALAVRSDIGGGAGNAGKDTFFLDTAIIGSLAFADVATFSFDLRFSAWRDQFCPSAEQLANGVGQSDYCKSPAFLSNADFNDKDPAGQGFWGARLYAGLTVVFALDRRFSAFLNLEFLPGAGFISFPSPRMAYEGMYNSVLFHDDPLYYGTAGLSLKF